jgi:hypothetical protein
MFFYSKRKAQMFLVTFQNPSHDGPTKIPQQEKERQKGKNEFSVFQEMVATNNCSHFKNPFLFFQPNANMREKNKKERLM